MISLLLSLLFASIINQEHLNTHSPVLPLSCRLSSHGQVGCARLTLPHVCWNDMMWQHRRVWPNRPIETNPRIYSGGCPFHSYYKFNSLKQQVKFANLVAVNTKVLMTDYNSKSSESESDIISIHEESFTLTMFMCC